MSSMQFALILCFKFEDVETALINVAICYLVVMNLPKIIAGIYVFNKDLKDCRPSYRLIKKDTISKRKA